VATNASGSGIFITDGDQSALVPYISPTVSLPVNIHITKTGLSDGESAKFKIERAILPEGDVNVSTLTGWHYVSTVFVTKRKGSTGDPIVKVIGLPEQGDWFTVPVAYGQVGYAQWRCHVQLATCDHPGYTAETCIFFKH
jgi:hypothetical protein